MPDHFPVSFRDQNQGVSFYDGSLLEWWPVWIAHLACRVIYAAQSSHGSLPLITVIAEMFCWPGKFHLKPLIDDESELLELVLSFLVIYHCCLHYISALQLLKWRIGIICFFTFLRLFYKWVWLLQSQCIGGFIIWPVWQNAFFVLHFQMSFLRV